MAIKFGEAAPTTDVDVWTCPRCESDHRCGDPAEGCADCGFRQED